MGKLGDVLKKVGGAVAAVGSVAAKAAGLTVVSSALTNVSAKLLNSPTPAKESAKALVTQLLAKPAPPVGSTTPANPVATTLQKAVTTAISTSKASPAVLKIAATPPVPPASSTPIKAASIPVQVAPLMDFYLAPTPSTPIKSSSYDLTGQAPPAPQGKPVIKVPSEMTSIVPTKAEVTKTATQVLEDIKTPGERNQQTSTLAIIVGAIAFVIAVIVFVFAPKRRRK